MPLGRGDVHHGDALAAPGLGHAAGHTQGHDAGAGAQFERAAIGFLQPAGRCRREKNGVVGEDVHDAAILARANQAGRDGAGAECVDTDHLQAALAGHAGVDQHHGRGDFHAGPGGQAGVDGLVEQGFAAFDLHVGQARERLGGGREFIEGGSVDQVDGKAHGHANGDGRNGEQGAHGVRAPLAEQQPARERPEARLVQAGHCVAYCWRNWNALSRSLALRLPMALSARAPAWRRAASSFWQRCWCTTRARSARNWAR